MTKNKKKEINSNESISITEHIIPILTFLSTIFTSVMIASKYIVENNNLKKHLIFNESLIKIDINDVVATLFIAIIVAVIFIVVFLMIKKNNYKNKHFKIVKDIFILLLLIFNSFLIYYDSFFKYNISLIMFEMLFSTIIWYFFLKKIKVKNVVEDVIILIISISITISFIPILSSFISMFNLKSTIVLSYRNDIYIAKEKNNFTESNKIVIYQTDEYSVLCDYTIEQNNIKTECSTYEVINNADLIFECYNK